MAERGFPFDLGADGLARTACCFEAVALFLTKLTALFAALNTLPYPCASFCRRCNSTLDASRSRSYFLLLIEEGQWLLFSNTTLSHTAYCVT